MGGVGAMREGDFRGRREKEVGKVAALKGREGKREEREKRRRWTKERRRIRYKWIKKGYVV